MLSPEGKCFTFDQRANGFVPGEGVGVVMLKRLADAERDRRHHSRRHSRLGRQPGRQDQRHHRAQPGIADAPGAGGLRQVRDRSGEHSTDRGPRHGHEAGRPDRGGRPEERVQEVHPKTGYCALGSVKSNIGHCLTAAGIAGLLKLVLALKHKQLPPTINFERLNEHIDLDRQSVLRQHADCRSGSLHGATDARPRSARSASAAPMRMW